MFVALEWSSWYGLLLALAGAILTIGGALLLIARGIRHARTWLHPTPPLIAFGHPSEDATPWMFTWGGSESDYQRQMQSLEAMRLAHLTVTYLIENKDSRAVRELATGLHTKDGATSQTVDECFVQVLAPGERVDVPNVALPKEMFEGMTGSNRAENFLFWATFKDAEGRRWKATYEPVARRQAFDLLSR